MAETLGETLERSIPLYEMIQELRMQLAASMKQADPSGLRFAVRNVTLELQVAVSREKSGRGGVKFWVLDAAGESKAAEQLVHTFKLELEPVVGAERESALVSDTLDQAPT